MIGIMIHSPDRRTSAPANADSKARPPSTPAQSGQMGDGYDRQIAKLAPGATTYDGQRQARSPIVKPPPEDVSGGSDNALDVASAGTEGSGAQLPHLQTLQVAFGHHDISGVSFHASPQAKAANERLGSDAFAVGESVAASGDLDLHTIAHEAAHVIQQRAGVSLDGDMGQADDGYERAADAVAERVVRGESVVDLLDAMTGSGGNGQGRAVQRKVNYHTAAKALGQVTDRESLESGVRAKFPLLSAEQVSSTLDDIESQDTTWSIFDVYRVFSQMRPPPRAFVPRGDDPDITMPSTQNHRKNYGFTTRTRLAWQLEGEDDDRERLPDMTQVNDKKHAEDCAMAYLRQLLNGEAEVEINASSTLLITLNNSPCFKRCAGNLAEFKTNEWEGDIVIRFANPHGSEEEFIAARQQLREAGITVQSFDPERYLESDDVLNSGQSDKFEGMRARRKTYRKRWNEEHPSDASDSTSDSSSGSLSDSSGGDNDQMLRELGSYLLLNYLLSRDGSHFWETLKEAGITANGAGFFRGTTRLSHQGLANALVDNFYMDFDEVDAFSSRGEDSDEMYGASDEAELSGEDDDLGHQPMDMFDPQDYGVIATSAVHEYVTYDYDNDEVTPDGNCLFGTLVALNANNGQSRDELRAVAANNPVATHGIGQDGVYAEGPELLYMANALDLTITLLHVSILDGVVHQNQDFGNGNTPITIAQIGAHFTPMRPRH